MNELTLTPPPGLTAADFSMIEQAVMETARGRWFLLEYARRQRAAETQRLTDAVDRLEALIASTPAVNPPFEATASMIAERLSDIVWRMREAGFDDHLCAELDRQIGAVRRMRNGETIGTAETIEFGARAKADIRPLTERAAGSPAAPPREPDDRHQAAPWPSGSEANPPAQIDPRLSALAHLDDLPLPERLALFC